MVRKLDKSVMKEVEKIHKSEYVAFIKKALVPGSEEHLELYW